MNVSQDTFKNNRNLRTKSRSTQWTSAKQDIRGQSNSTKKNSQEEPKPNQSTYQELWKSASNNNIQKQ